MSNGQTSRALNCKTASFGVRSNEINRKKSSSLESLPNKSKKVNFSKMPSSELANSINSEMNLISIVLFFNIATFNHKHIEKNDKVVEFQINRLSIGRILIMELVKDIKTIPENVYFLYSLNEDEKSPTNNDIDNGQSVCVSFKHNSRKAK
jgi:hypothetical protein